MRPHHHAGVRNDAISNDVLNLPGSLQPDLNALFFGGSLDQLQRGPAVGTSRAGDFDVLFGSGS